MSERVRWLDGWRGLVCCLMVLYHLMYDCIIFRWLPYSVTQWWPVFLCQRFIALSFIFLAGVSARFTRSNLRRALITAGAGLLVMAGGAVAGEPILFGILQFLSVAMAAYHFMGRYTDRVPDRIAPWLWAALYLVTRVISYTTFVEPRWLFWLGLRAPGFQSSDWVPVLPNIFMFLLGAWFGRRLLAAPKDSRLRTAGAPAWLAWIGRRTLIVYLVHQPVLYGACWLVSRALG